MSEDRLLFEQPDPAQVAIWPRMSGADRLQLGFDLWQFARDTVRQSELERHPGIGEEQLNRRVAERMSRGT